MDGQADAVVGNTVLREVICADLLATIARADLRLALLGHCGSLLLLLDFIKTRAQDAHTFFAVFDLRILVLAADHRAGRYVGDATRSVDRVQRYFDWAYGRAGLYMRIFA